MRRGGGVGGRRGGGVALKTKPSTPLLCQGCSFTGRWVACRREHRACGQLDTLSAERLKRDTRVRQRKTNTYARRALRDQHGARRPLLHFVFKERVSQRGCHGLKLCFLDFGEATLESM